jgi:hypothetical protein
MSPGGGVLHITNGDVVADGLRAGPLPGEVLPWRDALHDGPVPGGLALDELSRVRARFVAAELALEPFEEVLREFEERDAQLRRFRRFDEVALWFEHDLYDQLQLIQLLHWFALRASAGTRLSLVCIGEYPGIRPFHGLGQLDAEQLAGLWDERREITTAQLALGDRAWESFCSERPQRIQELLREELSLLPFLRAALLRHLEQFPSTREGLSRTERQILEALQEERLDLQALFRQTQYEREERPFMGDAGFLLYVGFLTLGEPLIEFEDGRGWERRTDAVEELWSRRVRLSEPGRRVLSGQVDRTRYQPVDRWLGGVHLEGEPAWRWGHRKHEIISQARGA